MATAALLGICLLLAGCYYVIWPRLRPQPRSTTRTLFEGVTYYREVRTEPRPMVIHVLKVTVNTGGIEFLVTPGDPDAELPLSARTTSEFLQDFDLQIAVNGDGFSPWHSYGVFDYYPHSGDPVDVIGFAASRGEVYSQDTDNQPTFYISNSNRISLTPTNKTYNAISGNLLLVKNGNSTYDPGGSLHPRTALAFDQNRRFLIIVVVDGRQPGYSEGATLAELADILISYGAHTAINLDGGGSSALVMEGALGQAVQLNSPYDKRVFGRERPVGNHLGIYANPSSDE